MIDLVFHEIEAGQWSEWITPSWAPFEFECIACDQVHQFEFRVNEAGKVELRLREVDV